jgi:hypothetical protein
MFLFHSSIREMISLVAANSIKTSYLMKDNDYDDFVYITDIQKRYSPKPSHNQVAFL